MAMVPADLKNYSPQIEKLIGTRHKMVDQGAPPDELNEIDRSIMALEDAAAAQQARWFSPEEARARDYERDGGRGR